MSRTIVVAALLALVACSAEPPTAPVDPGSELLAKWETFEQLSGFGVSIWTEPDGIDRVCYTVSDGPLVHRERTHKGVRQYRSSGAAEGVSFYTVDRATQIVLETQYEEGGRQFFKSEYIQDPYELLTEYRRIQGQIGGQALNCESDYDAGRTPVVVARIQYGESCWQSPPGNTVLPCP